MFQPGTSRFYIGEKTLWLQAAQAEKSGNIWINIYVFNYLLYLLFFFLRYRGEK